MKETKLTACYFTFRHPNEVDMLDLEHDDAWALAAPIKIAWLRASATQLESIAQLLGQSINIRNYIISESLTSIIGDDMNAY